jgi:cobalt-precorrin 5A hydrolase/precorrin-3B C17-methyltransferase
VSGEAAVLTVSVTAAGRRLAQRLPYEHVHGDAAGTVRERWRTTGAFVLFLATGAAVRIVAPLLADKRSDPAVVCVDEAGRFAVALCGGHAGAANDLARSLAAAIGAQAVVTTATDATGMAAIDSLPGFAAHGDVAAVTTALLDGRGPVIVNHLGWPVPVDGGEGPERLVITDREGPTAPGTAVLHPPSLVVGVGASTGAPPAELVDLARATLAGAGLAPSSVAEVATIDRRAGDPAVLALAAALGRRGAPVPVHALPARALDGVEVPHPSAVVRAAVGTPSVAEAAALLRAGPGAELAVAKHRAPHATVAVARRRRPRGHLALVGLGPGLADHRTPAAERAVRRAEVVIGYAPYVDACADLLAPHHEVVRSPIGDEVVRAKQAVADAAAGRRVALVCSGDAGIYGMASIALELAGGMDADVEVVPGVTAALAAAGALGAPLGHDHAAVSLSDLLTPWEVIAGRLRAAAAGDLVIALYNPRSRGRTWQLGAARDILLGYRGPTTPVGIVTDAGRHGTTATVTTLGELDPDLAGMSTCVVVGASSTTVVDGRLVTPRGYRP